MTGVSANTIYFYCQVSVTAISFILCLIIVRISYTLCRTASKDHREYGFIVLFNATVDLCFTATNIVVFPLTIVSYGVMVIFVQNPLLRNVPLPLANAFIVSFNCFMLAMILTHAIHFWYRFDLICTQHGWSRREYARRYLTLFLWIIGHFVLACALMTDRNEYSGLLAAKGFFDDPLSTLPYCVFGSSTAATVRLTHYQIIIATFYGMVIFFGYRTQIALRGRHFKGSPKTLQAQRRMLRTMALQALYPLVNVLLPSGLYNICALFGLNPQNFTYMFGIAFAMMPIYNSAVVLTTVPSFRRMILREKQSTSLFNSSTVPSARPKHAWTG